VTADLERLDVVIIGAGVIGLAVARALALAGRDVMVVEAEPAIGMHTSSRNSEVIHAGIYYPPGSLKARFCVAGKQALYEYCPNHDVAYSRMGKVIVAARDEEIPFLEQLKIQAEANGVDDLTWLDRAEVRALEPEVSCVRGLFSPSTGIIDSHGLMSALRRDAVGAGAEVLLATPVSSGRLHDDGVVLSIGGADPITVLCRTVINAAGLSAQGIAHKIAGLPKSTIPPSYFAKGHYFVLPGRSPFGHLVYPVPVPGGLGVHVTQDLAGQTRFGPDVSWVSGVDYTFDEDRASSFYGAIRRYFPGLQEGSLQPGYTGIRPKLGPAGTPAHDFVVQGPSEHGIAGWVALYGIESPGLTAALALAEHVKGLLA
jgi:L-2-hydroxyglutarate oxidase LhgO